MTQTNPLPIHHQSGSTAYCRMFIGARSEEHSATFQRRLSLYLYFYESAYAFGLVISTRSSCFFVWPILFAALVFTYPAHAQMPEAPAPAAPSTQPASPSVAPLPAPTPVLSAHDLAEQQVKKEEHQRILGIVPNFNTSYIANAAPLTPKQKLQLAFRGAIDPFEFVAAGVLAGYGQATNNFDEYGQGASGYAKRFGAAYADSFDGAILGNAVFPILLHEDPRYYRKGTGPILKRALYALSTAVITKNDNGHWGPNYANVMGNLAAGGISNLYYPPEDRGFDLTVQGAAIVTVEGDLGTLFIEFWPDISHKLFKK